MSPDENRAIVHRVIEEVWNQGNTELADDLLTTTFVMQDPIFGDRIRGIEGFKRLVSMHRTAFPDLHFTIDEESASDEGVAVRFTVSGSHAGTFEQTRPTGVRVTLTGSRLYTIVGGRISGICERKEGSRGG